MDTSALSSISNLPGPAKAGVAVLGGASLLCVVYMFTQNTTVLLIVALGIFGVGLLLVLYRWLLGWFRKRKAAPLERGILDNSAAAPNTISEPARRARLDDLRRSFETGIAKFKDSGKNIYSLPWYALVGEPGSGKTEAIRHCNVGFPPGLQDQLQGAGGTLNMNWWFTNHAIILDTAGRLMFEEVSPGGTSEWKEFLSLLAKGRPNCPINGMLLVIPSDSLIRDTADTIERKAGKIAQQLDSIQRTLGVRFPVFVIVTKCDLINGFREFFDNLTDPQLQHQMLGWSNPAALDQPFSAELVTKHLESVATALARRRQGLLLDPVNTEDPAGRRIDQVDALYALPQALLAIGPRLRRYLEMIFVAGEWSPKPLFLRGIYFTSSMREGSALDAELAEALKVPVESLPEGRVWERDRAFFLRDLFMNKVFRERGLVTRASDTRKLQRNRKVAIMTTAAVAIALLLGLTWFGARSLRRSIGGQATRWEAVEVDYRQNPERWKFQVLAPTTAPATYAFAGADKDHYWVRTDEEKLARDKFLAQTLPMVQTPISVPFVFRPLKVFSSDINAARKNAFRALYETSVLFPLVDATRIRLARETPQMWTDRSSSALAQMLRISSYASSLPPAKPDAANPALGLDPLLRYTLDREEDYAAAQQDAKSLQDAMNAMYPMKPDGIPEQWPPRLSAGNTAAALKTFTDYWSLEATGKGRRLQSLWRIVDALELFRKAEALLATATGSAPAATIEYAHLSQQWSASYKQLDDARKVIDAAIAELEASHALTEGKGLASVYDTTVDAMLAQMAAEYDMLLNNLPPDSATNVPMQLDTARSGLKGDKTRLAAMATALKTSPDRGRLADLDKVYIAVANGLNDQPARRYLTHYRIYARADGIVNAPASSQQQTITTIDDTLKGIDADAGKAAAGLIDLPRQFMEPKPIEQACFTSRAMTDFASRSRRTEAIRLMLTQAAVLADALAESVAASPIARDPVVHDVVPFTSFDKAGKYDARYHPAASAAMLAGWKSIGQLLQDTSDKAPARVLDREQLAQLYKARQDPYRQYIQRYLAYWTSDLRGALRVNVVAWKDFFPGQRIPIVSSELKSVSGQAMSALQQLRDLIPPGEPMATEQAKAFDGAVEAIKLDLDKMGKREDDIAHVIIDWQNLGDDPAKGRLKILSEAARNGPQFMQDYVLETGDEQAAGLAYLYWRDLSFKYLTVLADEAQSQANAAIEEFAKYQKFPLSRPKSQELLSVDELISARVAYERINPPVQSPQVTNKRILAELERLRGIDLDRHPKGKWVQRAGRVLDCLPRVNAQGKLVEAHCSIATLDGKMQKELENPTANPAQTYPCISLRAGGAAAGKSPWVLSNVPDEIGSLRYDEAREIQIKLGRSPEEADKGNFVTAWPASPTAGLWGCLRLLHEAKPGAVKQGKDKTWYVRIDVKDNQEPWSLWVALNFDPTLPAPPSIDDWP